MVSGKVGSVRGVVRGKVESWGVVSGKVESWGVVSGKVGSVGVWSLGKHGKWGSVWCVWCWCVVRLCVRCAPTPTPRVHVGGGLKEET